MYKNHKRSINSWREPGREWFLDGRGTRKTFFDRDEEEKWGADVHCGSS